MQPHCDQRYQPHYASDGIDDDLREARCTNKNAQPLLEVLKAELECGWDAGARGTADVGLVLVLGGVALLAGRLRG